jgi:hypothetical protein
MRNIKKILAVLCCALAISVTAAAKEESSIDVVTGGTAATGETTFGKATKDITPSEGHYKVAVLPYVDTSGLDGRSREMAANAIKGALKEKYPDKKGAPYKVASAKLVQQAMKAYPLENSDAPVLAELVTLGKAMGVDRVIYLNMLPVREKESGVMVIAGTQTYSATVSMKLKCVDVANEKYLFNQTVEEVGSSTSINFWRIGEPSKAKAVKRATDNAMKDFLTTFD